MCSYMVSLLDPVLLARYGNSVNSRREVAKDQVSALVSLGQGLMDNTSFDRRMNMSPMFMYTTPSCGVAGRNCPVFRSLNSRPPSESWKRRVKELPISISLRKELEAGYTRPICVIS